MGPFSTVFNKKMDKAQKKALIESVTATVKAINARPADFQQPQDPRISNNAFEYLVTKYCAQMTDGASNAVKLDIRAMRNDAIKFKGTMEDDLVPLLDGLMERGGIIHGQKVVLHVDVRDFENAPSSSPPVPRRRMH